MLFLRIEAQNMKKKAYVMDIIEKARYSYLDVVLEDVNFCGNTLGKTECGSHASSCAICSSKSRLTRNIRVWNKSNKKFKKGDEIYLEMQCKNYFLQIFFALLLPITLFIATFFLLEASHYSEAFSVMLAFLVLALYSIIFAVCSRYIFYRFFVPFV